MKKLFLLLNLTCIYLIGYTQTLTAPATVTSGDVVTVTASGETNSAYFSSIGYDHALMTSSNPNVFGSNFVSVSYGQSLNQYNIVTQQATKFTISVTNSFTSAYTVTLGFRTTVISNTVGIPPSNEIKYLTLTINPASVTYYNTAQSGSFTKNNCGTGTQGSQVTYTVPANAYSSTVSQSAANQLAINAVNAGGQAYANANGQCNTLYYSVEQTGMFTRNNCLTGGTPGPSIPYTKAAGAYTSIISQQDADSKAAAALLVDGQTYANVSGTCIYPPYISGQQQVLRNTAHNYTVSNSLPGDVFSWEIQQYGVSSNLATITQGQGTGAISIQTTSNFFSKNPTDFQIVLTITNPNSGTRIVDYNVELHARVASNTELVGFFSVGGQILEAWGNFSGTVTEVYILDSAGNRIGEAHSWTGTYVGNDIDISVQITSGGTVYPFQGLCWT